MGPTGVKGATGAKGVTGAKGATGTRGPTGARGPTGTKGATGAKGTTGSKGVTGGKGTTGSKGTTGAKGVTGARGPTGPAGIAGATVATSQTTTSTTYADLATVGPSTTVTISSSGKAIVTVTGSLSNTTASDQSNMGFAISGATTVPASDTQALIVKSGGNQLILVQGSATFFVTGLNAGSTTFTAKYRVNAGTGTFVNRTIIVTPLP